MKQTFPTYHIGDLVNQHADKRDFEVLLFESMQEPEIEDVHKHTFYEIIWIDAGTSRQTIDYKSYEIQPGSLFFISPNQVHEFEEWKALRGGSILFTEDFFLLNNYNRDKLLEISFLDNFYANPHLALTDNDFADVRRTIEMLLQEHGRPDRNSTIAQSLLHVLLAQIQRVVERSEKMPLHRKDVIIYKNFKDLLEQHFEMNNTASFYASLLNITQHHLNQSVKAVTGNTAGEAIRARSILEAKRLLTFSEKTVSEIAASLHYFDSSYFSKLFKSDTGQSPLEFRISMSEKYRIKKVLL